MNLCSKSKRDYFGMMKQIGFNYKKMQTLDPKQQQTAPNSRMSWVAAGHTFCLLLFAFLM